MLFSLAINCIDSVDDETMCEHEDEAYVNYEGIFTIIDYDASLCSDDVEKVFNTSKNFSIKQIGRGPHYINFYLCYTNETIPEQYRENLSINVNLIGQDDVYITMGYCCFNRIDGGWHPRDDKEFWSDARMKIDIDREIECKYRSIIVPEIEELLKLPKMKSIDTQVRYV